MTNTHTDLGSYSRKQVVRTIEQRSYDMRRRYNDVFTERVANVNRNLGTIRRRCF